MRLLPNTRPYARKQKMTPSELGHAAHEYVISYELSYPKFVGVGNLSRADFDMIIWLADCMARDAESIKKYWLGSEVKQVFINTGLITA